MFSLFERLDLVSKCNVDSASLLSFLNVIAEHYRNNAYHNLWHAADVTHGCYMMLRAELSQVFSPQECVALLISAFW